MKKWTIVACWRLLASLALVPAASAAEAGRGPGGRSRAAGLLRAGGTGAVEISGRAESDWPSTAT